MTRTAKNREILESRPNNHVVSKCVWFDKLLSRWSPSGCVTFGHHLDDTDGGDNGSVMCECNHLTEFALMLYDTIYSSEGSHGSQRGFSSHSFEIEIQLYLSLALMTLALCNSLYNRYVIYQTSAVAKEKALHHLVVLNNMLMLAVSCHSIDSLADIVSGHQTTAFRQWITRIIAPMLISLRFALYSFFTMLIMTPLRRLGSFSSGYVKSALKHSRDIFIGSLVFIAVVIILLMASNQLELLSIFVGLVSLSIPPIYTGIEYQCYRVLKEVMGDASISKGAQSYENIGNFILCLSITYGIGHLCQSFLYLSSVYWTQWYTQNLALLYIVFKSADLLTLGSSMVYIFRSIRVLKDRWDHHKNHQEHLKNPARLAKINSSSHHSTSYT